MTVQQVCRLSLVWFIFVSLPVIADNYFEALTRFSIMAVDAFFQIPDNASHTFVLYD